METEYIIELVEFYDSRLAQQWLPNLTLGSPRMTVAGFAYTSEL
jgi:hypothetical protein